MELDDCISKEEFDKFISKNALRSTIFSTLYNNALGRDLEPKHFFGFISEKGVYSDNNIYYHLREMHFKGLINHKRGLIEKTSKGQSIFSELRAEAIYRKVSSYVYNDDEKLKSEMLKALDELKKAMRPVKEKIEYTNEVKINNTITLQNVKVNAIRQEQEERAMNLLKNYTIDDILNQLKSKGVPEERIEITRLELARIKSIMKTSQYCS